MKPTAAATPFAHRANSPTLPVQMPRAAVRVFFERLAAANPHPTTELIYHNPFQLLVAVVLSAQATDKSVNQATAPLFAAAPQPQQMVALGEAAITGFIRHIGLFRTKARNVFALSRLLLERHNGCVPHSRAALEALPGVGRKTANVVLNTVFGEAVMAVDTHIFRLSNRSGLAPGKNVVAVEQKLMQRIPKEFLGNAHHWLILHGRYVCRARKPSCHNCIVEDLCVWPDKPSSRP